MVAIDDLVDKYMRILSVRGPRPIVQIKTRLGVDWLARARWSSRSPTTVIEVQRSVLGDARTLERVVAHEMVHHLEYTQLTPEEIAMLKVGIKPPSHGPKFLHGAQIVNDVMGADFVTVKSDSQYVQSASERDIYLLIARYGQRLGFAWAARLTPEATSVVAEKVLKGAKLVRTRDQRWTLARSKIKKYGGASFPQQGSREEAELRALYDGSP
jgi:hypothetical protein